MSTVAPTLRADERWLAGASPVERLSATMALFVLVSVAIHGAMVATTLVGTRPAPPAQQEITVEIVREVPKETPTAKAEPAVEASKSEPAKAEPLKAEAPKPEPAKLEPLKADPLKADPLKADPPKADPPKAEVSKPDPPPPAKTEQASEPAKPVAPPPADTAAEARKAETIKAMESELAGLKAEQAALQAENAAAEQAAAAEPPAPARPAALRDTGLGPLPDTFRAVALPSAADGAGEAVGYQDIVFSALAKAKDIGGQMGLPGSAGVHFEIDATGRLIRVELVHPSGVAALDAQALALVRKAAPFPPPPQGARRSFDANFNFVTTSGR